MARGDWFGRQSPAAKIFLSVSGTAGTLLFFAAVTALAVDYPKPVFAETVEKTVLILIAAPLAWAAYFLPAIIAIRRRHRHDLPILGVNLFAGWTVFAWLAAAAWSLTRPQAPTEPTILGRLGKLAVAAGEKALSSAEEHLLSGKQETPGAPEPLRGPVASVEVKVTMVEK